MILIDTHAHLYLPEFKNDIDNVLDRAKTAGIQKVFLPAIDSEVIPSMLELEESSDGFCLPMMGVHPCSVKDNYRQELDLAYQWLQKRKFSAVGESGLDFYWDKTFVKEQYLAF